jgi:chitinase
MPRFSANGAGVQTITITPPVSGAVIRYTENGTEPTSTSPIYSGPLQLATSAVIKARAFVTGETQSWESSASYTITSGSPTVEFVNTSDTGAAGGFHPLLVLSGIPQSTVSVSYTVAQPNGTSTTGTATFLPGENYRYFNVTATGSLGQIATVRLDSASGAIVGSKDIFSITIN